MSSHLSLVGFICVIRCRCFCFNGGPIRAKDRGISSLRFSNKRLRFELLQTRSSLSP